MLVLGRGEGMMRGHITLVVLVVFEGREVDHPQRAITFLRKTFFMADLHAQGAK